MKERTKPFGMIFRKNRSRSRWRTFHHPTFGVFTTKLAEFPRLIRKFSDRFLCYFGKDSPLSRRFPHYGMLPL
jgi:hypothetical protein